MSILDATVVDQKFLSTRIDEVLDFSISHISQIADYAKLWTDELDAFIRLQDKIIAETALLALIIARIAPEGSETSARLNKLANQVKIIARSERHRILLLRYPQTVGPLGLAHAALTILGYPDPEMHHMIMTIIANNLDQTTERIPYRTMEIRWLRSLIQPESPFNVDDLLPYTILGSRAHPIMMSREDVYAITHAIMYSTDFGTKPPPIAIDLSIVSSQIDSCIAWILATEDLDLLIELILAATILRIPWSPYVQFAWHYAIDIWADLGFLHSPSLVPSELESRSGIDATAYIFRNIYHTMYVAGLLCSTLILLPPAYRNMAWTPLLTECLDLSRNCRRAAEQAQQFCHSTIGVTVNINDVFISDVAPSITVLSDLLTCLEPSHTRWKKMLDTVSMDAADKSRIIADCAIIHAIRNYDLPKLLKAINEAIKIPDPLSPTVLEAIDFLLRQQMFDGVIGAYFVLPANRTSRVATEVTEVIGECLINYSVRLEKIAL